MGRLGSALISVRSVRMEADTQHTRSLLAQRRARFGRYRLRGPRPVLGVRHGEPELADPRGSRSPPRPPIPGADLPVRTTEVATAEATAPRTSSQPSAVALRAPRQANPATLNAAVLAQDVAKAAGDSSTIAIEIGRNGTICGGAGR